MDKNLREKIWNISTWLIEHCLFYVIFITWICYLSTYFFVVYCLLIYLLLIYVRLDMANDLLGIVLDLVYFKKQVELQN